MRTSTFFFAFAVTAVTSTAAAQMLDERVASLELEIAELWR
jgi:hypothetical protein